MHQRHQEKEKEGRRKKIGRPEGLESHAVGERTWTKFESQNCLENVSFVVESKAVSVGRESSASEPASDSASESAGRAMTNQVSKVLLLLGTWDAEFCFCALMTAHRSDVACLFSRKEKGGMRK